MALLGHWLAAAPPGDGRMRWLSNKPLRTSVASVLMMEDVKGCLPLPPRPTNPPKPPHRHGSPALWISGPPAWRGVTVVACCGIESRSVHTMSGLSFVFFQRFQYAWTPPPHAHTHKKNKQNKNNTSLNGPLLIYLNDAFVSLKLEWSICDVCKWRHVKTHLGIFGNTSAFLFCETAWKSFRGYEAPARSSLSRKHLSFVFNYS